MALPPRLAKFIDLTANPPHKTFLAICGHCGVTEVRIDRNHTCTQRESWDRNDGNENRLHTITCPATFDYFSNSFPDPEMAQIKFVWEYDPWVLQEIEQEEITESKQSVNALSEYYHLAPGTCTILKNKDADQVLAPAQIIPDYAQSFLESTNPQFGEDFSIDCEANFLLLRADLAEAFERQEFVLLLKDYNIAHKTREYIVCVVNPNNEQLLADIHGLTVVFQPCASPSHRALFYHAKLAFRTSFVTNGELWGLLDEGNLMTSGNISEYEWSAPDQAWAEDRVDLMFEQKDAKERLGKYLILQWGFDADFVQYLLRCGCTPNTLKWLTVERHDALEEIVKKFSQKRDSENAKIREIEYIKHVLQREDFLSGVVDLAAECTHLVDEERNLFKLCEEMKNATRQLQEMSAMDWMC